jgi:non-specific serine/threonine protein kinase
MYPLEAGDYRGAAAMFEDALRMARESGDRRGAAVNLLNLGDAELGLAKYRLATGHLVESLKSAVELGFQEVVVEALYGLAGVAGATGDHERFAMIVGAAQRAGDFGHVFEDFERQLYERGLEVARSRLGEERLADSIDAGRALTPEEAIEFAVALPPTGRDAARMLGPDSELAELSNRELDVLALTARGLSNEEIAKRLFLSVRTVERHHSNIYAKLRVSGKAARAAAAARYSRYETPET